MSGHRTAVTVLSVVVAVLTTFAATASILSSGAGESFTFVSVHGEVVEIYGRGLYAHDSLMVAAGNHGVDVVTLALAVPVLLGAAIVMARRRSVRAAALLAAMHAYLARVYASQTLGTAYNDLFLVHVAILGASLCAVLLLVMALWPGSAIDTRRLPRRGIAAVLLTTAVLTAALWLETPVTALVRSEPPGTLDHYTTLETHALDLAVIVPLLVVAGVLVLRGRATGSVLAVPVLGIVAMLSPALTAMTVSQVRAGVELEPAQIIGYVAGFVLLGLAAGWALWRIVRTLPPATAAG